MKFDYESAERFLKLLDPRTNEFTFQCIHPDRTVKPLKPVSGTLKEYYETLCQYNKEGYGVFVTINETDLKGRRISNIRSIRAVWQEDDDNFKGKLPLKPSMVIETSKKKFHRYFFVDFPKVSKIGKEGFDIVQLSLVQNYGSDKNAKDITRVLRLPGFYNTKPTLKKPFLVRFNGVEPNEIRYAWKKIIKKFKLDDSFDISGKPTKEAIEQKKKDEAFDFKEAVNRIFNAKNYYEPLLSLAMHLSNIGTKKVTIIELLEGLIDAGLENRPDQDIKIWKERKEGIEQLVNSALDKVKIEKVDESIFRNALVNSYELSKEKSQGVKYWLNPIITDGSVNMIHSTRGLGKTFFAMSLATAIASGSNFLKWKSTQTKVLYIDGELPYVRLKSQMETAWKTFSFKTKEKRKVLMDFMTGDRFPDKIFPDLAEEKNRTGCELIITEMKYKVVIIDNIATVFKTAEERQQQWKPIQDWLIHLRGLGITVILIHHDNKEGSAQRGFSNKEDILDTVIHLLKPKDYRDTDGAKFNVMFNKKRYIEGNDGKSFGCELRTEINKNGEPKTYWIIGDLLGNNFDLTIQHVKQGFTRQEIATVLKIVPSLVTRYIQRGLKEGLLTNDEANGIRDNKNNFDEINKKVRKQKEEKERKEKERLEKEAKKKEMKKKKLEEKIRKREEGIKKRKEEKLK